MRHSARWLLALRLGGVYQRKGRLLSVRAHAVFAGTLSDQAPAVLTPWSRFDTEGIMRWLPFTRKRRSFTRPSGESRGWSDLVPCLERLGKRLSPRRSPLLAPRLLDDCGRQKRHNRQRRRNRPGSNRSATNARNGVGSLLAESAFLPMAYLDVHRHRMPFDSSWARPNLPAGSAVRFAGLSRCGYAAAASDTPEQAVRRSNPTSGETFFLIPSANQRARHAEGTS